MKRDQRLQAAKKWIPTFTGKNLARGYGNHFGVDQVCALLELRLLGHSISDERIDGARRVAKVREGEKERKRQSRRAEFNPYPDSDNHHYYVAGYTSGGFAYGITWEESEAAGYLEDERPGDFTISQNSPTAERDPKCP